MAMNQGNVAAGNGCPRCSGTGAISRPPWLSGEALRAVSEAWTTTRDGQYVCNLCQGSGVVSAARYQEWVGGNGN